MKPTKALVISGGGSKGAFAGGIAEYLIRECGHQYGLFLGTSTGSLLVPLLSIGEIEKIKDIYTRVTQNQIFSTCPLIITKKNGVYQSRINHLGIVKMFIKGKKTFGESKNLRHLITEIINEDDFEKMQRNSADVLVTLSNLSTNQVEYKRLKDYSYEDYCDWIWGSANFVPFMSLLEKNGFEYADGGFADLVPISEAIYRGAEEIDVIVLKTEQARTIKKPIRNALELTVRTFDFMLNQISNDDIRIGQLEGGRRQVNINFYRPQNLLIENSLIFKPALMKKWWQDGFEYAKSHHPECRCMDVGV
ncbi:patatin family protein [Aquiflexum sp.]|uniref:patatin-like phospholipase family protein n=1 Tax=Aquiflexum sp. TaxID=1872584 RepID=UPI003593F193